MVGSDGGWDQVAAGQGNTCAVRVDHTLWCWGWGGAGMIGDGTGLDRTTPTRVAERGTKIDLGGRHTVALRLPAPATSP